MISLILTHFTPLVFFYALWQHQKTRGWEFAAPSFNSIDFYGQFIKTDTRHLHLLLLLLKELDRTIVQIKLIQCIHWFHPRSINPCCALILFKLVFICFYMFRGVEGGALSFPLPCLFIKINFSNNLGIQALKRFARFGTICTI